MLIIILIDIRGQTNVKFQTLNVLEFSLPNV